MPNLTGKTALVTGASRGMGRAAALALAAAGACVLVHYGAGAKEAEAVVAEIRKAGGRAEAVAADLSAADGAHKLAREARSIVGDRLDILVANAGVSKSATIEETTIEDFDRLFAVNVRAPFFLTQQLLPILSKGSSVIFLSSLAARAVVGSIPAYAATKGRDRYDGEAFCLRPRRTRHPRECGGARRRRHRYVELRQDGRRPRLRARPPSAQAAWRSPKTSLPSSRFLLPMRPGGSPATPSLSMAVRSCDEAPPRSHALERACLRGLAGERKLPMSSRHVHKPETAR